VKAAVLSGKVQEAGDFKYLLNSEAKKKL